MLGLRRVSFILPPQLLNALHRLFLTRNYYFANMILPLEPPGGRPGKVRDAMYGSMERSVSSSADEQNTSSKSTDETCSVSVTSATSVMSSSLDEESSSSGDDRTVRFNLNAEILCEDERTPNEIKRSWLGPLPLLESREEARQLSQIYLQRPAYQQAIEYLRMRLGRCTGSYTIVDLDDECFDDDEEELDSEGEEEIAKAVLTEGDARGLERTAMTQVDGMRGSIRFVKRHVDFVIKAQRLKYDTHAIADLCRQRSEPAEAWARTLGEADAQAVAQDFMLAL